MQPRSGSHRPLNASEQELIQNYVNRGYKLFVNRCAEGRKMSTEAIEKVAEGRVWTGAMAKDLGLVDELGGIDKALNAAATQAGIENYSIIGYPEKENIFASLLGNQKKHYINSEIKEYLGSYYKQLQALENIKTPNCIQHVCRLTLISNKLHMEGNLIKINKWLYPVSWIYGTGVWLRNKLFDWGIYKERKFDIPVISVGNITVGGTGKTPIQNT